MTHGRKDIARLQGVWRSHGYGTLLEIGPQGYRLFEETQVSCLCVFSGSLAELADYYVDVRVSPRGQAFSARRATGVTRVHYRRLKALPAGCAAPDAVPSPPDPVHVFEVFWHTFAERYALFSLRGVDWDAIGERYRPRIDARSGARRLFDTFVEMLRPLRDGHVELRASWGHFNAGAAPPAPPQSGARSRLLRERYLRSGTHRACDGLLEWGRLDDETGYLAIHAMAGQSGAANRPREDQAAAASAMDRVLRELGELPAMVVDVRDNGGGYDGVALRIAGRLIDRKRLAFTKAASRGEGFGGRQSIFIEPRGGRRYAGRIFLLTNRRTASAAEIFVLALLQHPRVTRVGEATHGELSDVMERHLPNGWTVTLSNELYRASDGELYETRGVPPHVEVPIREPHDAGRDPALEQVLAELRSGS